jgi:hypothetical protein
MGILLYSDSETLAQSISSHVGKMIVVLLTTGESDLTSSLQDQVPELLTVDVTGPRFSRLNFDAISLAILDLTPAELLSSGGRRLIDALGHLAEETLTLAFYGLATATVGALLQDGVTAGLNLIPRATIIDDVMAVPNLNALLASLSLSDVRLLALDHPVQAMYNFATDSVSMETVKDISNVERDEAEGSDAGSSDGKAMMIAFVSGPEGPTARIQMLTPGMQRRWPE